MLWVNHACLLVQSLLNPNLNTPLLNENAELNPELKAKSIMGASNYYVDRSMRRAGPGEKIGIIVFGGPGSQAELPAWNLAGSWFFYVQVNGTSFISNNKRQERGENW
jgi:hypothetical protein